MSLDLPSGRNFRLTTKAQWEKAAWGTDGRIWPWGDRFDQNKGNTEESGIGTTTPVGAYSSKGGDSPYGCADMAGNVWEWTASWYKKRYRVLRGGSFYSSEGGARCASRGNLNPGSRSADVGFRVCVSPA